MESFLKSHCDLILVRVARGPRVALFIEQDGATEFVGEGFEALRCAPSWAMSFT